MVALVGLLLVLMFGVPVLRQVMGLALPGVAGLVAMGCLSVLAAGWLLAVRALLRNFPTQRTQA
jgi:Ca2+-transporting ATPase